MQYSIRDLLAFLLLLAFYFAIERAAGSYWSRLLVGLLVVAGIMIGLQIRSMFAGAFLGTSVAVLYATIMNVLAIGDPRGIDTLLTFLLYPQAGYLIGITCAADRAIRAGI